MTAGVRLRRLARRVRRDWPGKIAAVLAALVVWWVASSEPVATTQRSLLVPLQVVGAGEDEVAVGVPQRVEVVITGPSARMDRLRAADVEAVLELGDVDGEFSRAIEARAPQTLRVTRVVPAEVIGRLEAVRAAEFPVAPRIAPATDGRLLAAVDVEPAVVTVEARDPVLELVAAVIAPVPPEAGDTATSMLVPIDEEGRPVPEARVVPEVAEVRMRRERRLVQEARPVAVAPVDAAGVSIESLSATEVTLLGAPDTIQALESVPAAVPDVTRALPPGRYDLPLRLDLPEGVAVSGGVTATVVVEDDAGRDDADAGAQVPPASVEVP